MDHGTTNGSRSMVGLEGHCDRLERERGDHRGSH
jgi:hypothetical protein